jgi:catechol 2,3-dioxygenase-like lactoylglutathione lyase family enzyme
MAKHFLTMLFVALGGGVFFYGATLPPTSAETGNALTGLVPEHITISVEDIDREANWYESVLGFTLAPPNDTNPDFLNHHLSIPGYRVDLIKYKGSSRPAAARPLYLHQGWIHIAFSVPDLGAALRRLQALHTDVTADNKDAKGIPARLVVHDPEGNEIEFFKR